jgi:hypothetical protein
VNNGLFDCTAGAAAVDDDVAVTTAVVDVVLVAEVVVDVAEVRRNDVFEVGENENAVDCVGDDVDDILLLLNANDGDNVTTSATAVTAVGDFEGLGLKEKFMFCFRKSSGTHLLFIRLNFDKFVCR